VKNKSRPASVLFDLDGTLADTAPDLAFSLNHALRHFGAEPLPYAQIRAAVSHGTDAMLRLAFGESPSEPQRHLLLETYAVHLCRETRLFPGMEQVLETLEQLEIPWGIVTNKPAYLTDPLVQALGLWSRAACVISGDTLPHSKPHPAPILHACQLAGAGPSRSLYLGDAQRDIQAGKAAGTRTLTALYGYLRHDDQPQQWGADGSIATPLELIDWLGL
jgi:phosphoglycolate phosphatase